MARDNWLIISLSGVTGAGKTTLAQNLRDKLMSMSIKTITISQDQYFFPDDSPKHVRIPELNHFNHDILGSLDMERMFGDIQNIISEKSQTEMNGYGKLVLIIEGFLVLNYDPIVQLSDLKYQLMLTKEECWRRRCNRKYERPEVPGYFEVCVWPESCKHNEELNMYDDIIYLDGTHQNLSKRVMEDIFAIQSSVVS